MNFRFLARGGCLALCGAIVLSATSALFAQETTGALSGVVRDPNGAVLPGATVTATGPVGNVVTTTDDRGEFRFPRLPSGRYVVTAALDGFVTGESQVEVVLGQTVRVDFGLALAGIAETVTVTSEARAVDLTTSATTTSISRERIEVLPRGRDFTAVVAQAAGAANESQAGGISIDGASGSENRFVIDGIDTTSPQTGVNAVPMRADFMEEVQVKSAGYAAEYGGSTGGVINAITKSGSNTWRGGFVMDYQDRSWDGSERPILVQSLTANTFEYIKPPKDDQTRWDPGFFLSGPIFRDRMWFFGTYQPGLVDTKRTVTFSNGVVNTFPQKQTINYGMGNVTGNAGSKLLYRVGFNMSPYETEKTLPGQTGRTSLTSPESYLRGSKGERDNVSGSVDYLPRSNWVVSARLGRSHTDVESTGVSFPGLIHNFSTASTPAGLAALPPEFQRASGFLSDVLVTNATAFDKYVRTYIGVDSTLYLNAGGEHALKFGFQTEKISNDVRRGYNADRILYYAGRSYTTTTGQLVQGQYGYFRLLNISTLGQVESRNDALFIQDTWKVTPRLTLNLGVRAEHERVPNYGSTGPTNAIEFNYGEKIAPRLGFSYDLLGDQKWKLYGSYGKYFDVMKYELPRGSFGGDKWVDYFFTWDSPNWPSNTTSSCATGSNTIAERPACPAGRFIEAVDRRFNSADPSDPTIDPNLKPMQEYEFQVGLTRELTSKIVVGARYVYKDLIRTIEDVGILVPGIGEVFYIANPGEGISLSLNDPSVPKFPKAKREYQGLELTFERRLADRWSLRGSYTLSRLYGNYSGLASSDENGRTSPNVNRFFDHIENSFDKNGKAVYGRLGTDRPHQAKAQFIYLFPTRTTLGLNQYVASGIPISEEARVPVNIPFFPYGRGNLGRTPVISQTDASVYQDFRFGGLQLQVGLVILNLWDQDTVTRRYRNRMAGDLPLTTQQFFAGGWDYEGILASRPNLLDVLFNQPDQFQSPREMRFTLKLSF